MSKMRIILDDWDDYLEVDGKLVDNVIVKSVKRDNVYPRGVEVTFRLATPDQMEAREAMARAQAARKKDNDLAEAAGNQRFAEAGFDAHNRTQSFDTLLAKMAAEKEK